MGPMLALTRTPEQMQLVMWYPTLQEMIAKLYILSLFYNLCVILPSPSPGSKMYPNVSLSLLVFLLQKYQYTV